MLCYTLATLIILVARRTDAVCKTQKQLVSSLLRINKITNKKVEDVMTQVDLKNYVEITPYENVMKSIGLGAVIPMPETHATALEQLVEYLKEGNKALDVGSGTGYMTACMALMVGETGYVVGMDLEPEFVERAKVNVRKGNPILMEQNRTRFIEGDGRFGHPAEGPYDAIFIGTLMDGSKIVPKTLLQQLKNGGRLVMRVDQKGLDIMHYNEFLVFDKLSNGTVTRERTSFC